MRVAPFALLGALSACAGPSPVDFDLGGVSFDLAQVVAVDADGAVAPVGEPLERGPGGRGESALPAFAAADGVRYFLVGLDRTALVALEPHLLPGPGAARLVPLGARPAGDPEVRDHPVPPSARVLPLAVGGGPVVRAPGSPDAVDAELLRRLTLRLRVEPCAPPGLTGFAPWNPAHPRPVRVGSQARLGVPQVLRVDARRALVRDHDALYLVHGDRAVDLDRPGPAFDALYLDAARAPSFGLVGSVDGQWALAELSLAPTSTGPGELRELLVAARQHHEVTGDPGGILFRAWLGPEGLHLDPGPRPAEAPTVRFSSVAIDAAGRALVAVHGEKPLFRAGPDAPFEAVELGMSSPTGTRAHATGVEAVPLVLATRDEVHLLDPASRAWRSFLTPRVPGEPTFDPRAIAGQVQPDGRLVLWVAAGQGGLATLVAGDLPERIRPMEYPAAYAGCAGAATLDGRLVSTSDHLDVALAGDHAALALRGCAGIALVRRRDRCVHLAPLDPALGDTGPAVAGVDAFVGEDGRPGILALGDDGSLRVATWEAP